MVLSVIGCSNDKTVSQSEKMDEENNNEVDEIRKQISQMSEDEKIGMLFVVRPDALVESNTPEILADNSIQGSICVTDEMISFYKKYPAGGFAIFKKNIVDEKQLINFTEQLHSLGNNRPLIYIDEEGGLVTRIANHENFNVKQFSSMEDIATTGNYNNAYEVGDTIGKYLNEYGIDVDFAPVADVNTNPNNTVIGSRAFGSDPKIASGMVAGVIEGLHKNGVMSCVKHFPGHGDTNEDTHLGYAQANKTWEEMLDCEMIPFKKGIETKTDFVMAAHITTSKIDPEVPASLSHILLTDKLRNELGFEGIIITDAFAMGAITQEYSSEEAAIKAIQAGVDIILMPENYVEAFEGIKKAVSDSTISMERIEESVYRILKLKQK